MADRSDEPNARGYRGSKQDRPPTTQEAVVRVLRESIASGVLRPGERLYQDAIAEQMGISRVPVREALNVLKADGQLEYSPHRGYWVTALTRRSVEEIKLIRALLEGEAMRLAFPKMDQDLLDAMEAMNQSMAEAHEADDIARFARLNHEFHFALFDRAGLPRLSQHIDMLWKSVEIYRMPIFTDHATRDSMLPEHADLIHACRQQDLEGALRVMETHRGKAVATLLSNLIVDDGTQPLREPGASPDEAAGAGG